MGLRRLVALAALFLLVPATVQAGGPDATGTISVGTADPQVGQDLVLIGTYSHVPQSRQPQFPDQPQAQIGCSGAISGGNWSAVQPTYDKKSLGHGVTQSTMDMGVIAGTIQLGEDAFCSAVYGYFYQDATGFHYFQLDVVSFTARAS